MSIATMSKPQEDPAIAFRADLDDERHGTPNGYSNLGCRCEPCTAAHREEQGHQRESRIARTRANGGIAPPPAVLGATTTYSNWRCSCDPCLAAHAAATVRRRHNAKARRAAKKLAHAS